MGGQHKQTNQTIKPQQAKGQQPLLICNTDLHYGFTRVERERKMDQSKFGLLRKCLEKAPCTNTGTRF